MKVTSKMALGLGVGIAALMLVSMISVLRLQSIGDAMDLLTRDQMPKVEALHSLNFVVADNARIARNFLLLSDDNSMASNRAHFDKNTEQSVKQTAFLERHIRTAEGKVLFGKLVAAQTAYRAYTREVIRLGQLNKKEEGTALLYGEDYKKQPAYFAAIKQLLDYERTLTNSASDAATGSDAGARSLVLGLGTLVSMLAVIAAVVITRGLPRQLGGEPGGTANVAQAVVQGASTGTITVALGDTTSPMAQRHAMQTILSGMVASVRREAYDVSPASAKIADANIDLSSRTHQQASVLEESAAELRSLARCSADATKQIKTLVSDRVERVEQGSVLVDKAGATMPEIASSIRRATGGIAEISAASVEQSQGVAQVSEALLMMDQATQQNGALVAQLAAGTTSLKGQATALMRAMAPFNIGDENGKGTVPNARHVSVRLVVAPDRYSCRARSGLQINHGSLLARQSVRSSRKVRMKTGKVFKSPDTPTLDTPTPGIR